MGLGLGLLKRLGTTALDTITPQEDSVEEISDIRDDSELVTMRNRFGDITGEFRRPRSSGPLDSLDDLVDTAMENAGQGFKTVNDFSGVTGVVNILEGNPGLFDFMDAIGLGLDMLTPGIPLMGAIGAAAPLFHGTIASSVPRILKKGIQAIRDVGPKGFPGSKKRLAAFATESPNIAGAFAEQKASRVHGVNLEEFTQEFFREVRQVGGDEALRDIEGHLDERLFDMDIFDPERPREPIQLAIIDELRKRFPNAMEPAPIHKPAEVVLGLSDDVRNLPHRPDTMFPSEKALLFEEGIPPEYIERAFIPKEDGSPIPGLYEATGAHKQHFTFAEDAWVDGGQEIDPFGQVKAPEGFDQVTLDGLMRFLKDLNLFK